MDETRRHEEHRRPRLADLAGATGEERDRYVDFLRAFSICVVVLGHWLGAVVVWQGNRVSGTSALDLVPGLWIATWFLQIMPIFFFVGGFSNLVTYRSVVRLGEGGSAFLRGRASRLLRPTIVFVVVLAAAFPLVERIPGLPEGAFETALPVLVGPLWFLGVYLALVVLTPVMAWAHDSFGSKALMALGAVPVAMDALRFGADIDEAGLVNLLFVWLFIHQLGFFYLDRWGRHPPRRLFWGLAVGGYLAMASLAQLDAYPASMVGCCSDEISNMAPPTLAIMALGVGQVGAAMLLRPPMSRWLSRRRPWQAVVALNASIMTMFLWHLTALVLTVGVLYPIGFPQLPVGSAGWWLTRPLWVASMGVVLTGLLLVFGRFERPDLDPAERYWDLEGFYAL